MKGVEKVMYQRRLIPIEAVEAELGEQAAQRVLQALGPKLTREMVDGARRYVMGVPGERIRRLKDRAGFAAAVAHFVRTNERLKSLVLEQLDEEAKRLGPEAKRLRPVPSKRQGGRRRAA